MQPYHYEMIAAVLDEAEQHGLFIDITQNSAWPTGGTHILPADSHQTLLYETVVVAGGKDLAIPVPPLKKPGIYKFLGLVRRVIPMIDLMRWIPQDKQLVKVIAGRLLGKPGKIKYWRVKEPTLLDFDSMVDLTGRVGSDGKLRWNAPAGQWQVFFCYAGSAGSQPLLDTRSEPGASALVVDHLHRQAAIKHLEAFLGGGQEYFSQHFGATLRAFFTDSFELVSPMNWTGDFLAEFKERRGYDLSPYLPVAYAPLRDIGYYTYGNEVGLPCFDFPGELGARIRYDFERTVSDLMIDEFIKALQGWAQAHGLQSRVQGYGFRADNLEMLGYSGIPETEQLYGGGMLHFLKLAGAAGTLYNRPVVTAESLVWEGRAYMTTPLKWRVGADRMFESGINQMIYHGFPYSHPDFPFPGFQPFASPEFGLTQFCSDFSRDSVFYYHFPRLNGYVTRMQYLLQTSKTVAKVGIFYNLFDFPNGNYKREELTEGVLNEDDPKSSSLMDRLMNSGEISGERQYIKEMAALGDTLVANGYYYLNFNRDRLLNAQTIDGKVVMGEAEFEALIFFKETHLPIEMVDKLADLSAQGAPILFVESLPVRQSGFLDWETNDRRVKTVCESISETEKSFLGSAEAVVPHLQSIGVDPQLRFTKPSPAIGFIHKKSRQSDEQFVMLRNRSRQLVAAAFGLPGIDLQPYELDALSGQVNGLSGIKREEGEMRIVVPLEPYQSRVIGFAPPEVVRTYAKPAPQILSNQGTQVAEIGGWRVALSKREMDGSYRKIKIHLESLIDWRAHQELSACCGPAEYLANLTLPQGEPDSKRRYFLRFDWVYEIATVTLNQRTFDPLLLPPYQVEVTEAIQPGENQIKVVLETTYRNLLVGYGNAGSKLYKSYKKKDLAPAGLIGKAVLVKV